MIRNIIQICAIFTIVNASNSEQYTNLELQELSTLTELPMEKLLVLRNSLKHDPAKESKGKSWHQYTSKEDNLDEFREIKSGMKTKEKNSSRRTGHHEEVEDHGWFKDGLKSKGDVQTIFQTTVTVLAFLAFGGYLVSLVITTVKGSTPGSIVVQTMTTTTTKTGRQIDGRSIKDLESLEGAIQALNMIAQGYAKYHFLTNP